MTTSLRRSLAWATIATTGVIGLATDPSSAQPVASPSEPLLAPADVPADVPAEGVQLPRDVSGTILHTQQEGLSILEPLTWDIVDTLQFALTDAMTGGQ